MHRIMKLGALGAMAVAALPAAAHAIISWGNDTGSTSLFSWAGGYSNNGLFGDPVVSSNSFTFAPPAFTATNPGSPTATDTIQVTITVQPGQQITDVLVSEIGTRTSTNRTTVQGTLRIKDLTVGSLTDITNSLGYVNDTTTTPIGWTGSVTTSSLGFGGGVSFQLTLTNNLSALLSGQSITKTGVVITFLPTPGVLAGMGMAGLALTRRRR